MAMSGPDPSEAPAPPIRKKRPKGSFSIVEKILGWILICATAAGTVMSICYFPMIILENVIVRMILKGFFDAGVSYLQMILPAFLVPFAASILIAIPFVMGTFFVVTAAMSDTLFDSGYGNAEQKKQMLLVKLLEKSRWISLLALPCLAFAVGYYFGMSQFAALMMAGGISSTLTVVWMVVDVFQDRKKEELDENSINQQILYKTINSSLSEKLTQRFEQSQPQQGETPEQTRAREQAKELAPVQAKAIAEILAQPLAQLLALGLAKPLAQIQNAVLAKPLGEEIAEKIAEPLFQAMSQPLLAESFKDPFTQALTQILIKVKKQAQNDPDLVRNLNQIQGQLAGFVDLLVNKLEEPLVQARLRAAEIEQKAQEKHTEEHLKAEEEKRKEEAKEAANQQRMLHALQLQQQRAPALREQQVQQAEQPTARAIEGGASLFKPASHS